MASQKIRLDQIVVEERQRQDLGDLKELADSIDNPKFGLLQPVVVERRGDKFHLLAGGRRLAAHALLQRTEIEATIKDDLTDLERQMIELEENIRRKNLSWQEEADAVDKIHKLKMLTEKDWSTEKTAELIGKSRRSVFNSLELATAIKTMPDVAAADKPLAAFNRLKQHKQFQQRKEDVIARRAAEERQPKSDKPLLAWFVHQGDCVEYMKTLAAGTQDMILTDPPWAVNYDDILIGGKKSFDDSQDVLPTVRDAVQGCYRLLRDERFMVMYWPTNATPVENTVLEKLGAPKGITLHELGRWFLTSAGFRVWPRPIIWYKPNKNFGSVSDPAKQFNSQYETILWAFKGDARFFKRPGSDVFVADSPGVGRLHPNEKNEELSEIFIDICTVRGENVFDPFAGGGVHGEAALRQERNAHLVELDPEFAEKCSIRCEQTSQRKLSGEIPDLGEDAPAVSQDNNLLAGGTKESNSPTNRIVIPSPNRAKIALSEKADAWDRTRESFDQELFDK